MCSYCSHALPYSPELFPLFMCRILRGATYTEFRPNPASWCQVIARNLRGGFSFLVASVDGKKQSPLIGTKKGTNIIIKMYVFLIFSAKKIGC